MLNAPQWTSTGHLSMNLTGFDLHASGCCPWWVDSNTRRYFQHSADLRWCDYSECGRGSLKSSPAALIPDPPQRDFPFPAETVEGWWPLFCSAVSRHLPPASTGFLQSCGLHHTKANFMLIETLLGKTASDASVTTWQHLSDRLRSDLHSKVHDIVSLEQAFMVPAMTQL